MTSTPKRRRSVHIGEFKHVNPIPNASRIGNIIVSGLIRGPSWSRT